MLVAIFQILYLLVLFIMFLMSVFIFFHIVYYSYSSFSKLVMLSIFLPVVIVLLVTNFYLFRQIPLENLFSMISM
jgi:hypothetical protein